MQLFFEAVGKRGALFEAFVREIGGSEERYRHLKSKMDSIEPEVGSFAHEILKGGREHVFIFGSMGSEVAKDNLCGMNRHDKIIESEFVGSRTGYWEKLKNFWSSYPVTEMLPGEMNSVEGSPKLILVPGVGGVSLYNFDRDNVVRDFPFPDDPLGLPSVGFQFLIYPEGDQPLQFTISIDGEWERWTVTPPQFFVLINGQTRVDLGNESQEVSPTLRLARRNESLFFDREEALGSVTIDTATCVLDIWGKGWESHVYPGKDYEITDGGQISTFNFAFDERREMIVRRERSDI